MSLPSAIVGRSGAPLTQVIDARWTQSYAAGLGHDEARYLDTSARPDVLAHPLFPVCFEWPLFLDPKHRPAPEALTAGERVRGVHATHDLILHREIRAGLRVTTTAKVVQVESRRSGAYELMRLDSSDEQGRALCSTWYGTLYRGVAVEGDDAVLTEELPPPLPASPPGELVEAPMPIAANAAHVYTECARIWNPIHTDAAVARAAGLPSIILHGTATLAMAISRVVAERFDGEAERVGRMGGRFRAMVAMPSRCTLRMSPPSPEASGARFEVRAEDGGLALDAGFLALRSDGPAGL